MKRSIILLLTALLTVMVGNANSISINDIIINAGSTKTIQLTMPKNDKGVSGFQFDVEVPDGMILIKNGDHLFTSNIGDFEVNERLQSDGSYRVMAYSPLLSTISLKGTEVITLMLKADKKAKTATSSLSVKNVVFSDAYGEVTKLPDTKANITIAEPVKVVAKDKSSVYGDNYGDLQYDLISCYTSGTPTIRCDATASSSVGKYDIIVGKGTLETDTVTLVDGILTISKAPLMVTAKSYTREEGEANPTFEIAYSGWKNNETEAVLIKKPTATTTATAQSAPGTYPIIVSGGEATNYDFTYVNGTLTITGAIPPTTYTLTISANGNGAVSFDGNTIRSNTSRFTVNEGSNAVIVLLPDNGYRIKSVIVNGSDVTASISYNQYTINNINSDMSVEVIFEVITESQLLDGHEFVDLGLPSGKLWSTMNYGASRPEDYGTYVDWNSYDIISSSWGSSWITPTLSDILELESECNWIWETKNGINGYTVNGKNGNSIFLPAAGVRTGKVYHIGEWVYYWTSTLDTQYEDMACIILSTTSYVHWGSQNYLYSQLPIRPVSKEGKVVPPTTYTLSIKSIGNGSVLYDGTTIRSKSCTFTLNEGTNATITFIPDNGYRIKSLKVNNFDVTSSIFNNQYTINIKNNTTVEVEFEAIPITAYTLTIKAIGNGSASYAGTTIRSKTSTFTVNEGTSTTITFVPDYGYRIKSVMVNNSNVTSSVSNNQYTINSISQDNTLEVEFVEELKSFANNGINYSVTSYNDRTVCVSNGSYGSVLEVPAQFTYQNTVWTVVGIDNGALTNNPDLAAIIWNPLADFTVSVGNPNLLLYVKSASYAPATIKNVIVNNVADNITLADAASGNNFYCPQEFTAKSISYTHNYGMITGIGESRGWETIALPFDVQKIAHSSKGEITPFANWKSGDALKPFWLMELGTSGFVDASAIKANTPYIISMPNHTNYKNEFRLNGNITFSAQNVKIKASNNLQNASSGNKTFHPNYVVLENTSVYVLNVNNDYVSYSGGSKEGSTFVLNLRKVHPFEAYMTSTSKARQTIAIQDNLTTGIRDVAEIWDDEIIRVYNLSGQLLMTEENKSLDEIKQLLSAGVYIVNGKKIILK